MCPLHCHRRAEASPFFERLVTHRTVVVNMTEPANYGAVKEEGVDYDIANTYYVKERELTSREKWTKFLLAALPILAAFLIVGGFTLYLLFDSGILGHGAHAGGGGGEAISSPSKKGGENPFATSKSESSSSVPSPISGRGSAPLKTTTHASGSSACSANEKCAKLGLVGACCPTNNGVMLNCCN